MSPATECRPLRQVLRNPGLWLGTWALLLLWGHLLGAPMRAATRNALEHAHTMWGLLDDGRTVARIGELFETHAGLSAALGGTLLVAFISTRVLWIPLSGFALARLRELSAAECAGAAGRYSVSLAGVSVWGCIFGALLLAPLLQLTSGALRMAAVVMVLTALALLADVVRAGVVRESARGWHPGAWAQAAALVASRPRELLVGIGVTWAAFAVFIAGIGLSVYQLGDSAMPWASAAVGCVGLGFRLWRLALANTLAAQ